MKKIFYIVILCGLTIASCTRDNYLDFQPRGVVIPSSIDDFRLILDQVSEDENEFFEPQLSKGFGPIHGLSVFLTDNQQINDKLITSFGLGRSAVNAYIYRENFYTSLQEDPDWASYYNQIYVANVVLDGLEKVEGGTLQEIAQLKAEAKLHRAWAYFNLVNIYAVHYNASSAATDLGVPIREGIELEGLDFTRNTIEEVYDYILENILSSVDHLIDVQSNNVTFRPSKAGAYGLLAKVYLYQGNYENAVENANNALLLKNSLRDFNTEVIDDNGVRLNPEIVADPETVWFKLDNSKLPLFVSDELVSSYDTNDLRSQWYASFLDAFGEDIEGFVHQTANGAERLNVGISVADVILTQAEANARLGNITPANDALNTLRETRYALGTYSPISIADANELLTFIKEERRREMVHTFQRLFDIKRYNLFDNDDISVTHSIEGTEATILPNSLNWVFPIAQKYIQQNPEIEQNPRD